MTYIETTCIQLQCLLEDARTPSLCRFKFLISTNFISLSLYQFHIATIKLYSLLTLSVENETIDKEAH